jgi:hypothetical protein
MVKPQFNRLSFSCRVTLIALATIILPGALIMQTIVARAYYDLNSRSLQLVASMAVSAGSVYLPRDPRAAVLIADAYVQDHGVAPAEIICTELSSDNDELTIKLDRKVPKYVALFAVGLARDINVTASARLQAHNQRTVSQGTFSELGSSTSRLSDRAAMDRSWRSVCFKLIESRTISMNLFPRALLTFCHRLRCAKLISMTRL